MGRYHSLVIAGGEDEHGDEPAMRIEVPGEPVSLAREILLEAGFACTPELESTAGIGYDADVGRIYDVEHLSSAIAAIDSALSRIATLPEDEADRFFNERQGLEASLRLFRVAQTERRRVVLEI